MRVLVGSKNDVKLRAAQRAFAAVWLEELVLEVVGQEVQSGVPDQPIGERETITGARNRARRLHELGGADFYVGIEGGLMQAADCWMECGWAVILNRAGVEGISASPMIMLPPRAQEMILAGADLNDVCAELFGVTEAGNKTGYFGLMTNGAVDRERAYTDAIALAQAPFVHPQLFW